MTNANEAANDFFMHVRKLDVASASATISSVDPQTIEQVWEFLVKMPNNFAIQGFSLGFHAKHLEMLQLLYSHIKAKTLWSWVDPTASPQDYPFVNQLITSALANKTECTVICKNKNKGDMFKRLWPDVKKRGWVFNWDAPENSLIFVDPHFLRSPAFDTELSSALNWVVKQNTAVYLLGETWDQALLIQAPKHPIEFPSTGNKREAVLDIITRSAPTHLPQMEEFLSRCQRQRLTTALADCSQNASVGARKM